MSPHVGNRIVQTATKINFSTPMIMLRVVTIHQTEVASHKEHLLKFTPRRIITSEMTKAMYLVFLSDFVGGQFPSQEANIGALWYMHSGWPQNMLYVLTGSQRKVFRSLVAVCQVVLVYCAEIIRDLLDVSLQRIYRCETIWSFVCFKFPLNFFLVRHAEAHIRPLRCSMHQGHQNHWRSQAAMRCSRPSVISLSVTQRVTWDDNGIMARDAHSMAWWHMCLIWICSTESIVELTDDGRTRRRMRRSGTHLCFTRPHKRQWNHMIGCDR